MTYRKIDINQELRKVGQGKKTKGDIGALFYTASDGYPELQAAIARVFGITVKVLLCVFLFASVVSAETIHITGVKRATEVEKTYKTSFNQNLITGIIG